jgi:hypothetical protein
LLLLPLGVPHGEERPPQGVLVVDDGALVCLQRAPSCYSCALIPWAAAAAAAAAAAGGAQVGVWNDGMDVDMYGGAGGGLRMEPMLEDYDDYNSDGGYDLEPPTPPASDDGGPRRPKRRGGMTPRSSRTTTWRESLNVGPFTLRRSFRGEGQGILHLDGSILVGFCRRRARVGAVPGLTCVTLGTGLSCCRAARRTQVRAGARRRGAAGARRRRRARRAVRAAGR